jgi:hypothetical protein
MRRKLPPFVECWRDRHGKLRIYFRKDRGRRIPLPTTIGSSEFDDAYRGALAGQLGLAREKHVRPAPRTIGALVLSYVRSSAYLSLRETTKVGYAARIETLRAKHGHRTVAGLTRHRIVTGILQPYADRPGAALGLLKILRILIRHAIDVGWLNHDPSLGIKRPKTQELPDFHWNANRMASARLLAGGSQKQDVRPMKSWQCSATRHSPRPSGTRARRTRSGLPLQRWRSSRDEGRTQTPKPFPMVWARRQKQKKNQSEQIETGGPGRTRTSNQAVMSR